MVKKYFVNDKEVYGLVVEFCNLKTMNCWVHTIYCVDKPSVYDTMKLINLSVDKVSTETPFKLSFPEIYMENSEYHARSVYYPSTCLKNIRITIREANFYEKGELKFKFEGE